MPSFILIHPTVWLQHTNVTDRQDGQWSDMMGPTVLQLMPIKKTNANNPNQWLGLFLSSSTTGLLRSIASFMLLSDANT